MNFTRTKTTALAMLALLAVSAPAGAQEASSGLKKTNETTSTSQAAAAVRRKKLALRKPPSNRAVIPPVTVLNNPEYLSGEASVSVAANSNPLLRIGMAQNGVTLIEFPATDKFFAIHAGNSDLVTVEKSPSLKRDHHLVLRAGSGFLVPAARARGPQATVPATSIIAQMDSGMAITVMIYPVALLKQQAHRIVINYKPAEVVSARRAAGLATNLDGPEAGSQTEATTATPAADSAPKTPTPTALTDPARNEANVPRPKPDYREPVAAALSEAIKNPKWFKKWTKERHGLMISTLPPRDLNDSARLVLFAVRNAGREPLRIISGYPDLYVETLNEKQRPVEAGTKVEKLNLASSADDNSIQPGATRYFVLAYEAPILGAQQHLKIVVAHMSAADEPAMADLTAVAR